MSYAGLRSLLFILIGAALLVACDDTNLPSSPEPVASVQIEAPVGELLVGASLQLAAVPQNAAGEPLPGRTVTWSSSDSMVARVSSTGLVTARSVGTAAIKASSEGREGSVSLNIVAPPPPVATIRVGPADQFTVQPGTFVQLTAVALAANDSVLDRTITWSSNNVDVANVSSSGIFAAYLPGTALITASSEGVAAHVTVLVAWPSIARLEPTTGGVVTLYTDDVQQLGVRAFAADGEELFGRIVTWTVADPTIATVDDAGVVRARAVGSTDVTATAEGQSVTVAIDVRSRIVRIDMDPGLLVLGTAEEALVTATARGQNHVVLQRPITWRSSNESVARVDATGVVTAVAPGVASIIAESEGQQGVTSLTVVDWGERPLVAIGDSAPPATLFVRTWTDASGVERTSRVYATSGAFRMMIAESNRGRYRLDFNVWVYTDGSMPIAGQYGYGGEWTYNAAAGVITLTSYAGQTLTARQLPDGRLLVTGRLEADAPLLALTFGSL